MDFDSFLIVHGNCINYATGHFNRTFSSLNNQLLVMNFNIQSFDSKIDEFSAFLDKINIAPHILVLCETWFAPSTCRDISGYKAYHCTRPGPNERGGISIYVLETLNLSCLHYSFKVNSDLEHVRIILKPNNENRKKIEIIGIYRPPYRTLLDNFFRSLESLMNKLGPNNDQIIAGDFNICGIARSPILDRYLDIMRAFNFMPHINIITRPNPIGNDSCIDHIWSNFGFSFQSGVFNEVIISDHFINFASLPVELNTSKKQIMFRDHSESNILKMVDKLTNFSLFYPLLTATLDSNSKFDLFYNELDRIYKTCCPIKTKEISMNRLKKPWLSQQLLNDIQEKYELFKRYRNGFVPYDQFLNYKKELKRKIETAKSNYYLYKFENCRSDSSSTWKVTNNILGRKNKSNIPPSLKHDSDVVTDEMKICNIFNQYFVNVGSNLASTIHTNDLNPINNLGDRHQNSFSFMATTPQEVFNTIKKFDNKKSSLNNIPIFILKKISYIISPLLSDIFNHSINDGIFPEKLKTGRVTPIHKEGDLNDVSNYRPITSLSVFSKLFEKLVHKRMNSFISRYNLIKPNQFGFQKNKCTSDAILEFLENVYDSFNENKYYLAVFLDFSKAFDTISHDILLRKLEHMGFRGPIYQWIKSFLTSRKQYVNLGGSSSDILDTKMGVPQGSTLGPLLFILYINDMSNSLENLKIVHFADDSTIHTTLNKSMNIAPQINTSLSCINNWLIANKLHLNIGKTKYMIISIKDKPPDLNLIIGSSCIERTNVQKFLGIYIDDKVSFRVHTNKIAAKLSQGVGLLRKMKHIVPRNVLKNLFYAFIYSRFTYGITCYGSAYQNQIQRIKNLVNRALKLVVNRHTLTPDICKNERLFDFDMAYRYFCSINMYRIIQLNNHEFLATKLQSYQTNHSHETRSVQNQHLTLPLFRLSKCQRSFLYNGIQIWNLLPLNIRIIEDDLNSFKKLLKNHLLS